MTASVPFSAPPTPPLTGLSSRDDAPLGKQVVDPDRRLTTNG